MYVYVVKTTADTVSTFANPDAGNAAAIVGEAVGGAVLFILLVTLCVIMWHVVNSYKKKGAAYFISVSTANHGSKCICNPLFDLELAKMNGNNLNVETDPEKEARVCKYLS